MATSLLGLGYKRRQGKDTAARFIIEEFGHLYDIRRYAFADALKVELYGAYCDGHHPYWTTMHRCLKRDVITDSKQISIGEMLAWFELHRALLREDAQLYGTEYRRKLDAGYWVKKLAATIREEQPQIALITDVRFPNEMGFCRSSGAVALVERVGFDPSDDAGQHASERTLDGYKFNYNIRHKDGTLTELREKSVRVFKHFLRRQGGV